MEKLINVVLAILLLAAVGYAMFNLFILWADTGPGCPGDPFWLGYCSEVAP